MIPEIATEGKLAQKLIQICDTGKSGILTIEYQKIRKVICFENGRIRYATSNAKNEWFLEYLIRNGVIDKTKTTSFMAEPAISEKAAHLLASAGLITEERAIIEAHKLITKIVMSCFRINGKMFFSEGRPDLRGKITSSFSPRSIILEYYRQLSSIIECKAIIGKDELIALFSSSSEEKIKNLELNSSEKNILKLIDGTSSIKALLRITPDPQEQTIKSIAVLTIMGIIETKDKKTLEKTREQVEKAETSENPKPEEETKAESDAEDQEEKKYYYELYEKHMRSNFFQLLGVSRQASEQEIRTNYYYLAKELHPDRFQKQSMEEVRPLMEDLFARISEAYSTLTNGKAREKYEEEVFGDGDAIHTTEGEIADKGTIAKGNFIKGKKLFEEGKYNEALKFLSNAVALDATRWEYFLQFGLTLAKNPLMRSEAIKIFKKVIVLNPTSAEAYLELGILYRKIGNLDEAKHMLKSALQWEPNNQIAAYELKEIEKAQTSTKI